MALRAAEVERYGVIGHGVIFGWYRDGLIDGDDEVALIHGDAAAGWRPLSVPLVNIRATLAAVRERGLLSDHEANALLAKARTIFYQSRTLAALTENEVTWTPERRNEVALLAAEQLVDRHSERLALDVVQSDVDRRDRSLQDAATLEILAAIHLLP